MSVRRRVVPGHIFFGDCVDDFEIAERGFRSAGTLTCAGFATADEPAGLCERPTNAHSQPLTGARGKQWLRCTKLLRSHNVLHFFLVDVEVGGNFLHIVVLFQRFDQPDHLRGLVSGKLDVILRHPGHFGGIRCNAVLH